ncbi:MAG: hypothetical protein ABGX16_22655 [Pirellulales bacterium]
MHIHYTCPACHTIASCPLNTSMDELVCPHCQKKIVIAEGAIEGQRIRKCLVCPSTDLYVRKDFPQRLGVGLVIVGILGSSIAWYHMYLYWTFAILFATALADVLLYFVVGEALMCYRCDAHYRGVVEMDSHGPFDLETHEKYRQLAARTD